MRKESMVNTLWYMYWNMLYYKVSSSTRETTWPGYTIAALFYIYGRICPRDKWKPWNISRRVWESGEKTHSVVSRPPRWYGCECVCSPMWKSMRKHVYVNRVIHHRCALCISAQAGCSISFVLISAESTSSPNRADPKSESRALLDWSFTKGTLCIQSPVFRM